MMNQLYNIVYYLRHHKHIDTIKPCLNLSDEFMDDCLKFYADKKQIQTKMNDGLWGNMNTRGYISGFLDCFDDRDNFRDKLKQYFDSNYTYKYLEENFTISSQLFFKNNLAKMKQYVGFIKDYDELDIIWNHRALYDAYQVNLLLKNIMSPVVCEIGCGIGNMEYHLLRMNPDVGIISVDLPEMLTINRFMLLSNFNDSDICFLSNSEISSIPDCSVDVVVNTHSISEMSKETVDDYCNHIIRILKPGGFFYCVNRCTTDEVILGHSLINYRLFPLDGLVLLHESPSFFSDVIMECLYQKKRGVKVFR